MNRALPLAGLAIAAGGILLATGGTGSSLASVVKGKPDKSKQGGPAGSGGVAAPAPATNAAGVAGALSAAVTQLGVPYKWGGELARIEFDCSGLVQWAYGQAGIHLPRTAAEQYAATKRLSPGEAGAGDLVFFGNGHEVSHVGIVVRPGVMIDAPHTGANVRYESFPTQLGAAWGADTVIGYGRA